MTSEEGGAARADVESDDETESESGDDDRGETKEVAAKPAAKKNGSAKKAPPSASTPKAPKTKAKASGTPGTASKKSPAAKKASPAASKASPAKVSYVQLIHDAIVALKDRTGSSSVAIQKYILANNPDITAAKLKTRLLLSLKSGVSNKRFLKVKASFKIHPDHLKKRKQKSYCWLRHRSRFLGIWKTCCQPIFETREA